MDFYKYIDEINLIKNQNNTERDLYYLVKQTLEPYCILRNKQRPRYSDTRQGF